MTKQVFLQDNFYAVATPAKKGADLSLAQIFTDLAAEKKVKVTFSSRWSHIKNVSFMYVHDDVPHRKMQEIADRVSAETGRSLHIAQVNDAQEVPYFLYPSDKAAAAVTRAAVLKAGR